MFNVHHIAKFLNIAASYAWLFEEWKNMLMKYKIVIIKAMKDIE